MLRMKFGLFVFVLLLFSCNEETSKTKDTLFEEDKPVVNESFEQQLVREVEGKLQIPRKEKYTTKVYRAHLNADNSEDAIVTVNRYEFALSEASASPNPAKVAELGYTGNYNYFLFYDGLLKKFSNPIAVASSPKAPLKVVFENIQSNVFKDITIEYRIRNSAFRNYYLIHQGAIQLMFQWKLFDAVGTTTPEVNFIAYDKGSRSSFKDIIVYPGKIVNYTPAISDIYAYEPNVIQNGEPLYRFFFEPSTLKYMTKNR